MEYSNDAGEPYAWKLACTVRRGEVEKGVSNHHLVGLLPYRFFPSTYAHSTWQRLLPFFRLPGHVLWGREVTTPHA
jgi:hypothetical protein